MADEEDLEPEIEDEENQEEPEESGQDLDNKNSSNEKESFLQNITQRREKREKAQLDQMQKRILTLWDGQRWYYPHFTFKEKMFLWKMKQKKKYSMQIASMENTMKAMQQAYRNTYQGIISSFGSFLGYFALFIFIIIVVIVIVAIIFPWLFPDDESSGGGKKMNSAFGVKGDKFYGCRAIYKDETLAQNGLIEQYSTVIQDSITALETIKVEKTDTKGTADTADDEVYEITLDVTLTVPAEDFEYSNLDLENFKTDYQNLYNIVYDIAQFVATNDAGEQVADETDIVEVLKLVKYFGFDETLLGTEIVGNADNVMEIILLSLEENNSIQVMQKLKSASQVTPSTMVTIEDLNSEIQTALTTKLNVQSNKIRLDKVFVKDFIFEDEESYCEGIEEHQYIAFIYMAKTDVEFDYVSYMVTAEDGIDVELLLSNGGDSINLDEGDKENLGDEDNTALTTKFDSNESLGENLLTYQNIDTNNLSLLANGESLYSALKLMNEKGVNMNTYLSQTTDDNGNEFYSVKIDENDMVLRFISTGKFMFNDEARYD